ncbi:MAG: hypothetical protein AAGA23_20785 [Pseudomonadota bacterium]
MNTLNLTEATRAYRNVRYAGATPQWPEASPFPRRLRWVWAPASAAAAALIVLMLAPGPGDFGADYEPRRSAYSALKQARSAMPETFSGSASRPSLPAPPRRATGFSAPAAPPDKADAPA